MIPRWFRNTLNERIPRSHLQTEHRCRPILLYKIVTLENMNKNYHVPTYTKKIYN